MFLNYILKTLYGRLLISSCFERLIVTSGEATVHTMFSQTRTAVFIAIFLYSLRWNWWNRQCFRLNFSLGFALFLGYSSKGFYKTGVSELKQLRRPQRRLQKNNRFNDQNNSSARASRFLVWCPLRDFDVKPPNLPFYGGREHTTTNFPSSFWTWIKSLRIQLQEKSPAFDILSGSK